MMDIRDDIQALFNRERSVADFLALDGELVKQVVRSRRTLRLERGGRQFYLKLHYGVGWREILKNLLRLDAPVLGARDEYRAIGELERLGVDTMRVAAFGEQGLNPARRRSFLLTDAIEETQDLEHWLPGLYRPGDSAQRLALKRAVIAKVAWIARQLHGHGVNHRDFYLCHFRIALPADGSLPHPDRLKIYLMDLHRAQLRHATPHRWRVKDLAGLLYSSLYSCRNLNLTSADYARFIEAYSGERLRGAAVRQRSLWRDVVRRTLRTYSRDYGKLPTLPPLPAKSL